MTRSTLVAGAIGALAALALAACGTQSGLTAASEPGPASAASATSAPAASAPASAAATAGAGADAGTSGPAADQGTTSGSPTATAGSYVDYADWSTDPTTFAGTDVVLFFAASWCPTCQRADENLRADPAAIPAGLTIVKTDYDAETDLKQRYGVTVQHTFVQINPDGEPVARWTGSETADAIAGQVQ